MSSLKLMTLEALIPFHPYIMVDWRKDGVVLTPDVLGDRTSPVVLRLGRTPPIPMPDLVLGKEGVSFTLIKNNILSPAQIPWEAITMTWVQYDGADQPEVTTFWAEHSALVVELSHNGGKFGPATAPKAGGFKPRIVRDS